MSVYWWWLLSSMIDLNLSLFVMAMIKNFFTMIYLIVVVHGTEEIDCNDGGFYIRADPKSKTHFYKCDNGEPVRFKCPDGLWYNPKLHVCDWPKNVDKSSKGSSSSSKPYSNVDEQYSGNNGKPASDKKVSNNKKPSNNEVQYNGNNQKPSNSAHQQNSKPTHTNTGQTSGSSASEVPWHYQSYSADVGNMYPVQIIDNNLDLDGLGYKECSKIDIRKA